MRFPLILLSFYVAYSLGRPGRLEDLNDREASDNAEYEEDAAEDYLGAADDNQAGEALANKEPQEIPDSKQSPNKGALVNTIDQAYSAVKSKQKYAAGALDDDEQPDSGQRITNRGANKYENPRSAKKEMSNEEGEIVQRKPHSGFAERNEESLNYKRSKTEDQKYAKKRRNFLSFKKKYNSLGVDNNLVNNNAYRDRRQAGASPGNIEKEEAKTITNDDDEAVIKSHLKRLSSDEIEQLLNSLSEDKRALLKKIIDSDATKENPMDKREVSKKATAIEENISGNNEIAKAQNGEERLDAFGTAVTANPKDSFAQAELAGISSFFHLGNNKVTPAELKSNEMQDLAKIETNPATAKKQKKRDINEEYDGLDSSEVLDASPNDMPNDKDRENALYHDVNTADANVYKRDALSRTKDELSESIKLLEESFPNNNCFDDSDLKSDMAPLVRVKRKTVEDMKKKSPPATNLESSASFRDDYDDDGGEISEFNDDEKIAEKSAYLEKSDPKKDNLKLADISSNTPAIGSDSDGMAAGVEGVDDYLMLASRNRRGLLRNTTAKSATKGNAINLEQRPTPSIDLEAYMKVEKGESPLGFQDANSFGPVQHSASELSRYKRIRRLKHNPQDAPKPNG